MLFVRRKYYIPLQHKITAYELGKNYGFILCITKEQIESLLLRNRNFNYYKLNNMTHLVARIIIAFRIFCVYSKVES